MRLTLATLALAALATTASAQTSKWFQDIKLSGYGMVQYQASDQKDNEQNKFNLRLARLALEGRAHDDFYWKVQMQVNGTTKDDNTAIRLVDLFGEWQKYEFLKVKAGQFKRPFTFENPMHPITQGFMSYSQNVSKLSGFADRTGEHASNGRDIGLQIQGDLLKVNGRNILHYQVGVFNGEGINTADKDNRKDIIGGVWVSPVKGLRIGAFGWTGSCVISYAKTDNVTIFDANGNGIAYPIVTTTKESVRKNRYALSAEYANNDWTFRTEYIHNQGFGANRAAGDKADGVYALCIAPIIKDKLHVKARYDLYRDRKDWASSKTFYEIGADYWFTKHLQLEVEYARVNDRSSAVDQNYNLADVELNIKF
jgi:hypothetical protein